MQIEETHVAGRYSRDAGEPICLRVCSLYQQFIYECGSQPEQYQQLLELNPQSFGAACRNYYILVRHDSLAHLYLPSSTLSICR